MIQCFGYLVYLEATSAYLGRWRTMFNKTCRKTDEIEENKSMRWQGMVAEEAELSCYRSDDGLHLPIVVSTE